MRGRQIVIWALGVWLACVGVARAQATGTIEGLFASDLAFLQDLYRRVNAEGHSQAAVTCPGCRHEFTVDLAASRATGEPALQLVRIGSLV